MILFLHHQRVRLCTVFWKLREDHLKLAPKKCHLLQRQVKFLGHIINGGGDNPAKIKVITNVRVSGPYGEWWIHSFCSKNQIIPGHGILPSGFNSQLFLHCKTYVHTQSWAKDKEKSGEDRKSQCFYRKLTCGVDRMEHDWAIYRLKIMSLECALLVPATSHLFCPLTHYWMDLGRFSPKCPKVYPETKWLLLQAKPSVPHSRGIQLGDVREKNSHRLAGVAFMFLLLCASGGVTALLGF